MANKLTSYTQASFKEMKKVTWPTKKEAKNYTFLVIGISLALAAFLGLADLVFSKGLEIILK